MNITSIPLKQLSDQLPTQRQRQRQQLKGRRVDGDALVEVVGLLATRFGDAEPRRDLLIEYLHVLNDHFGQLATPHIAALAKWMRLAQTEVFEVASFYHHFDVVRENAEGALPQPPRLTVRVCDGLSCELAGAKSLLAKLPDLLQADVRVIPAPCVGRCEQAPVVVVGQKPIIQARSAEVVLAVTAEQTKDEAPAGAIRFEAYKAGGGYSLLADCLSGKRQIAEVIKLMSESGLRGLGGAGFPAGRKWGIVRAEPGPRLMAVNIDEGEPGTFKDRVYLERDPHRFLEGMLIAAWAVEIEAIYIYLRDEYHGIRSLLEAELAQLSARLAAAGIPVDRLPPIELRRGAGAYICGEESAMIESIEGKRGMPRLRPPYVAQRGVFNRPTLQHNMETLHWVREIIERGPGWFSSHGRNGRTGLRSFSLSGRVNRPGVHIAPAGITLRELVEEYGGGLPEGHTLYGYLPGGASGGIFPERLADVPLDFDTLQPHGGFIGSAAVMVLTRSANHWDRATDAARNLMHFFEDESCGQCTPCRSGTSKARALIAGDNWDTGLLAELSLVMRDASICGLGQAAPNPVDCVIKYFPEELGAVVMSAVIEKPNAAAAATIEFQLDGKPVTASAGETILQVAKRNGVKIPHLCYKDGLEPVGNCRSCMVEVDGERVLAASCCRAPSAGMTVKSTSERAVASQKLVLELLMSDMPREAVGERDFGELSGWAGAMGVGVPRFAEREQPAQDLSHPAIAVNLDACIQCTRCLRACRDEQVNDVIGLAFRGAHAQIVFDQGDSMGQSTCVACGECVQACPTGALSSVIPKVSRAAAGAAVVAPAMVADKVVDSLCPFCGVGCQVTYHVNDDKIVHVEGRNGPANDGRLCVKGRYGFDYAHHPQRLTTPLIRRADAPKTANAILDADNWREVFREASWEEALDVAANGFTRIRDEIGPKALVGFGSAKGSNEEAYLFQKLVRTGFRTNNVDHCTRLCHASSVAALLEGIGSGAVSNPVRDVAEAEVVIIIGANPSVNHPVAASFIKNAVKQGTKLIVLDPRRGDLARLAYRHLAFKPDTDVALLNAMMFVIVEEGLTAPAFIESRTIGFEELKANLAAYSPEAMAPVCGIDAATIREVARLYATSKASMILWGMGISQHIHGTDNARCLIALSLMTGQIARPGTGLHPLRGQNNVQGASDAGLIPMMFPDYQRVDNADARAKFEKLWGMPLDPKPGLTVVEVMDAAYAGDVRGLYVMGENPAMSDPDANHARAALAKLDHLVVQDIFLTETAAFADVILPASAFAEKTGSFTNTDRLVQLGQAAVKPPGDARQDLWIIQELAMRIGLDWDYADVGEVFDEMRRSMPSIAGITWQRLQDDGAVTYPCMKEGDPGDRVEFVARFPTPTGKARFVPAGIIRADEQPDTDYPLVLITGRQLEHWHTGSMTRRSAALDAIEPDPVALIHPQDLQRLGILPGEVVTLQSRRGEVVLYARADEGSPPGTVFVPFCYAEAAINRLTNPKLDPFGKIPEFKFCAVRAFAGGAIAEGLVGAN